MSSWWFLVPVLALASALLALAPLGAQVLRRGVVFIDLAIAQSAAAGALTALTVGNHPAGWITQSAAILSALIAAGAVAFLARHWPTQREALIGLVYVASATLALLTASLDTHGSEHLHALLAADVLWAEGSQTVALAICALAVYLVRQRLHRDRWFYLVFAVVASIAVQTLGLFVVFAALITPALWQRRRGWDGAPALALSGLACGAGLGLSWLLDAPSGSLIALCLALTGILSVSVPGNIARDQVLPSGQSGTPPANRSPEPHHD